MGAKGRQRDQRRPRQQDVQLGEEPSHVQLRGVGIHQGELVSAAARRGQALSEGGAELDLPRSRQRGEQPLPLVFQVAHQQHRSSRLGSSAGVGSSARYLRRRNTRGARAGGDDGVHLLPQHLGCRRLGEVFRAELEEAGERGGLGGGGEHQDGRLDAPPPDLGQQQRGIQLLQVGIHDQQVVGRREDLLERLHPVGSLVPGAALEAHVADHPRPVGLGTIDDQDSLGHAVTVHDPHRPVAGVS